MRYPSLEYFIEIVRLGNITRASSELHITQQSLSNYLKNLEDFFQTPLFTRKPTFAITQFGQQVYESALKIRSIYENLDNISNQYRENFVCRIGCPQSYIFFFESLCQLNEFRTLHPGVNLKIVQEKNSELDESLRNGKLDFFISAIESRRSDYLQKHIITGEGCVLIHPALLDEAFGKNRAALEEQWRTEGVDIKDLCSIPMLMLYNLSPDILADRNARDYPLNIKFEGNDISLLVSRVRQASGYLVLPLTPPLSDISDLCLYPLRVPRITRTIKCYTRADVLETPHLADFWNIMGT